MEKVFDVVKAGTGDRFDLLPPGVIMYRRQQFQHPAMATSYALRSGQRAHDPDCFTNLQQNLSRTVFIQKNCFSKPTKRPLWDTWFML